MPTRNLLSFLAAASLAACGQSGPTPTGSQMVFADGIIETRELDPPDGVDSAFEVTINAPGWVSVELGAPDDGMNLSFPVESAPERFVLKVSNQRVSGTMIVDQFLAPLLGDAFAAEARRLDPSVDERDILVQTFIAEYGNGSASSSAATLLPSPLASSTSRAYSSRGEVLADSRVPIAGWLYVPRREGARSTSVSLDRDGLRLAYDGVPTSLEESGAVLRELSVEYRPERPVAIALTD
jgi:hypothetical protein